MLLAVSLQKLYRLGQHRMFRTFVRGIPFLCRHLRCDQLADNLYLLAVIFILDLCRRQSRRCGQNEEDKKKNQWISKQKPPHLSRPPSVLFKESQT